MLSLSHEAVLKAIDDATCASIGNAVNTFIGNVAGGMKPADADLRFQKALEIIIDAHERTLAIVKARLP